MAGELKVTIAATLTKGTGAQALKRSWNNGQQSIDVAGSRVWGPVTMAIGTSEETIAFTDITTMGVLFVKNLDATNYVTFGPDASGTMAPFGKAKPGEEWPMRLVPGITYKIQANTAACNVDLMMISD